MGERILDLSLRGALVACDEEVREGEELLVDFRAPWLGPFVSVTGRVSRIIEGFRDGDPGYAAGLRFEHLDGRARRELAERLELFPQVAPRRRYPVDYAESVRRVSLRMEEGPPPLSFIRRSIVMSPFRG